jgi:hypothetical protein
MALKVFSKWGTGAGEFVRAMKPASIAKPQVAPTNAAGDRSAIVSGG